LQRAFFLGKSGDVRLSASLVHDTVEWDVENWSRALDFWQRALGQQCGSLHCLELGARRGGLSLWLGSQGHEVICSDIKDNSEAAGALHRSYGVDGRISYATIDATAIPYENHFDVIAFKSMLGGVAWDGNIERQRAAVHSMHRALRPGGMLLFAENLTGSRLHRVLRQRFIKWNSVWRYVTIDEMLEFLQPFAGVQWRTTGVTGLLGRSAAVSRLLGKLDGTLLDRVVPPASRYIMFGVARK
jgi:SAM-dependent methyltransferase